MELLIGFILSFVILLFGVFKGIFMGYCISLSFIIFAIIAFRMGYSKKDIIRNALDGGKNSLVVLKTLVLIGLVTASWLTAGTIPAIVFYSMKVMNPRFFLVFTFLTTSLVSYMLGTSSGTASTIGIVLIIMARGGNINLNLVGGAILSGCYFGDRCSPMSSSASLISNLTDTELYPMLKRFREMAIVPFIISTLIYFILSLNNPLDTYGNTILADINEYFIIDFMVLLPAIVMLVLSILQINVRKSMTISVIIGTLIAVFIQKVEVLHVLKILIFGYRLEPTNPLSSILKGGGIVSMLKLSFVIFVSCAMSGVLAQIGLFEKSYSLFGGVDTRKKLFKSTGIFSFVSGAFGGNQSIAVIMVHRIMEKVYDKLEVDPYEFATDISNTAILISPMIPWNTANLVVTSTLELSSVWIVPYAFYLYIPIVYNYIRLGKTERNS